LSLTGKIAPQSTSFDNNITGSGNKIITSPNSELNGQSCKKKRKFSLCFNGHFPGEPGLASFIRARDNGSDGDNWSHKTYKAPVKSSPPTNHHPTFSQAGCPSCRPTNRIKALKGTKKENC